MNSASFHLCLLMNINISAKLLWSAISWGGGGEDNNKYLVTYTHHLRERFTFSVFFFLPVRSSPPASRVTSPFLGKNRPLTSQIRGTFKRSRANLNRPIRNTFIVFCWNESETILLQRSPELLISLSSTCAEELWVEIGSPERGFRHWLGVNHQSLDASVAQAWMNKAKIDD